MKKILVLLTAVAIIALSGAAYAGTVGHVTVEIDSAGAGKISNANVLTAISNTFVPSGAINHSSNSSNIDITTAPTLTKEQVLNEIGAQFNNSTLRVLTLPKISIGPASTSISSPGLVAAEINNLDKFSAYSSAKIRFFLRHKDRGTNPAIEFSYKSSGKINAREYAFVSGDGASRSSKPTADNKYLVFHVEVAAAYEHPGSSAYYPLFAEGKDSSSPGGGGCGVGAAAPFAFLLFAGAGLALKALKKSEG